MSISQPQTHTGSGGLDAARFAAISATYNDRLVAWARRHTDPATAEDAAQEALLRAWRYRDSYRTGQPAWPWLKAIARRVLIDTHNRHDPDPTDPDHLHTLHDPTATDDLSAVTDRTDLHNAMAGLPRRQRTALKLTYLEGWTHADAARFLGITDQGYRQLLHRARTNLARRYANRTPLLSIPALTHRLRTLATRTRTRLANLEPTWLTLTTSAEAAGHALLTTAIIWGMAATSGIADRAEPPTTVVAASDVGSIPDWGPSDAGLSHVLSTTAAAPGVPRRTQDDDDIASVDRIAEVESHDTELGMTSPSAELETGRDEDGRGYLNLESEQDVGPYDMVAHVPVSWPCEGHVLFTTMCDVIDPGDSGADDVAPSTNGVVVNDSVGTAH